MSRISRRDGKRGPRWIVKYREVVGSRTTDRSKSFKTEREAKIFDAELTIATSVVGGTPPDTPTLRQAFDRFVEVKTTAGRKKGSLDAYAERFKHLKGLAGKYLSEITTAAINDYFSALRKHGVSDGVLHKVREVLSGIFDVAISEGSFLGDNPVKKAAKIKMPKPKDPPVMIPKDKLDALTAAIPAEQRAAFLMMAHLGLRRGEVDALTRDDFADDFSTVHISRTRKNGYESAAKTDKSNRVLVVPTHLRDELRKITPRGPERRMFRVYNTWGKKYLEPACAKVGLPRLTPRDLRDIHAGTLIRNGVDPASVSRQLGHASVRITVERYTGTLDDSSERAAEVMERLYESTEGTK